MYKDKNDMKTVGIVTVIGDYNYGNRLQNYALSRIIENMGFKVKTLNFRYVNNSVYNRKKELLRDFIIKLGIGRYKRNKRFREFNKMINFSDIIYNNSIIDTSKYDYFVCGSDQVWNYNFKEFGRNTLLGFSTKEKNIAYAASFGVDNIPEKYINIYKKYIGNFKDISVREYDGQKILYKLTQKEYPVVLDPTFLISREEWERLSINIKDNKNKKYILVYILGDKIDEIEKKYSKEYDIIYMNDLKNKKIYNTGPYEFLGLVKDADLIITDSYHACVFSIIFKKCFVVLDRIVNKKRCMEGRINTLLDMFDLKERKINHINELNDEMFRIDYSKIEFKINRKIDESKKFLVKNLN